MISFAANLHCTVEQVERDQEGAQVLDDNDDNDDDDDNDDNDDSDGNCDDNVCVWMRIAGS